METFFRIRDGSKMYWLPGPAPSTGVKTFFLVYKGAKTSFWKESGEEILLIKKEAKIFLEKRRAKFFFH